MPASYREIAPTPRLARFIECYWSRKQSGPVEQHLVLPDGCVDILFSQIKRDPVSLSVVGLMTAARAFDLEGGLSFFGVRFRPAMAGDFLPEIAKLSDRVTDLRDLIGPSAQRLFDQLGEAVDARRMASIMDVYLRPLAPPDSGQRVLLHLPESGLDEIIAQSGLSARHLRRLCVDRAGVPPKYLQRILRFRKASERIVALTGAQPNWAQFAAACGYYDQAHFIREFQEFAGCSPGRFLQSQRPRMGLESKHDEPIQT